MSYKILQDGYLLIETNTFFQEDVDNRFYEKMIEELKARDLATYDALGNFNITPDEIFLFSADPITPITIDDIKRDAYSAIDSAAGQTRLKYITHVAGQSETYQLKADDAREFKAAGYPDASINNYPMVKAEAEATGETYRQAAETIRITEVNWKSLAAMIEKARRSGKINVSKATTEEDINTIKEDTITLLGTF